LKLSADLSIIWDELLDSNFVIQDTRRLFVHAHRPYIEYYLPDINLLCDIDSALCQDKILLDYVKIKKEQNSLISLDSYRDLLNDYVNASDAILILTNETRYYSTIIEVKKLGIRGKVKIIKIPDIVSERDIGAGWYIVQGYFHTHQSDFVLVNMGWERIIYIARIKKMFNVSVFDFSQLHPYSSFIDYKVKIIKGFIKNKRNMSIL
jgi:hypothetical protein